MSDRDDGDSTADGTLCEADVFEVVTDLGRAHHFTRWLAIMRLENKGKYPINSSTIQRKLFKMTGDWPKSRSVITSMESLKDVGILEKEEIGGLDRHHWYITEYGQRIGRELIALWVEGLECPEAADALRACANNDTDETEE